jgi:hypothetical protein
MRTPTTYDIVHVVVPAHDEQALVGECVRSLLVAVEDLVEHHPEVEPRLTVVADRCADLTAQVAAELGADVIAVDAGCVGSARQAGVRRVEAAAGDVPADRVWVANTDADTVVPPHWLTRQLDLAATGFALVLGTAVPDHRGIDPTVLEAWHDLHTLTEGHPHVHGANLGISLAALQRAGGFTPVQLGEDVALSEAVRRAGLPWCATATTQVTTSSRLLSRVESGFAGVLRDLQATRLVP